LLKKSSFKKNVRLCKNKIKIIAKVMIQNLVSNSIQTFLGINYYSKDQIVVYLAASKLGLSLKVIGLILLFF